MHSRRAGRMLARTAVVLLIATAISGLWLRHSLRASLPQADGERQLVGLQAAVTVTRDALGVPTIEASSRLDVARALGFLHAQERLFQMDLLRRRAAGELAELVGAAALPMDRTVRVHRLRARARAFFAAGPESERLLLEAYAAGANSGRLALAERPFEYLLLREEPAPWLPEDSLLAAYAMFLDLHDENARRESDLGLMHDLLSPALFAFLAPLGTEWDAPVVGGPYPESPLPGPDVLDLRAAAASGPAPASPERTDADRPVAWRHEPSDLSAQDVGSNNWVVAGAHTPDGRALLANDMHLAIGVPNIWYRAAFSWPDGRDGVGHRLTGVTLPGVPSMVVGTNTRIAWGFTNSQGDWTDLVELQVEPGSPQRYRTPTGPRAFETFEERIRVKGGAEQLLSVRETIWGPVVDEDHAKRLRAVRWTAHSREAINVGLLQVETARSLDEALEQAALAGIPPQNFVCAEASGRIGWTIMGRIPRRVGFDGRLPSSWASGERRWDGWLAPGEYPRIVDPAAGRIWTANARVVEGEMMRRIGDGGYAFGARARQIRDDLLAVSKATERDMLQVQLDDRAVFLSSWRDLLLRTLAAAPADPKRAELRTFVENWGGRASIDSVGYRAVRAFRIQAAQQAFTPLVAPCAKADERFDYLASVWQYEAPLWRLVSERPAHLLDPRFASWDAALLAAADAVIADLTKDGRRLAERTWGERNTARIQHPLSRAVPLLGRWLDMPRDPLPGDGNMPRVASSTHGASQRLVVSPGHERDGFFHMPGGQSGHPLSDHYAMGHSAWVKGEPTPFLPGAPVHTLTLRP